MGLDINLHPKQLQALNSPATEILYGGAVGGGKALGLDTPIMTIDGWKTMGTVKTGDVVFDEHGKRCNVVAKSEVDTESDTYEVEIDGGRRGVFICDGRHQWPTTKGIRTTEEMCNQRKFSIPILDGSLEYKEQELPIHPYIFGVFLFGALNGMIDRRDHKHMMLSSRCNASGYRLIKLDGGIYAEKESWYNLLDSIGFRDIPRSEFYIPDMYKYGTEEQRRELIAGAFDVAGTVFNNKTGIDSEGQTEIFCYTESLANDLTDMLLSLGERPRCNSRNLTEGRRSNPLYDWRVRLYPISNLFKSRALTMKRRRAGKKSYNTNYGITRITKLDEPLPKQCIEVDSRSHCYIAGRYMIPTHNSYLMRIASIIWAMQCPGIQIYLFRLTRKELEDNHMVGGGGYYELLANAVNSKYVKINNSKYQIQFRNGPHNSYVGGSIIHLSHCQHEDDKYIYHGAEMTVLMIDEATHFTWSKYTFLRTRVRVPTSWRPPPEFIAEHGENFFPRILLGTNPGGVSHNRLRKDFVKIAPAMTIVKMPNSEGGMLRQYIPARLEDNPSINKAEYEGRVMAVGDAATARMLLEGDWDAVAGGMFDDVWDEKVHMIEPFVVPESWYVDRTFDWGYADPFSVGWWAQSDGTDVELADGRVVVYPKGTLFRIAEWYGWTGEENVGAGLTAYEIGLGIKRVETTNPAFKNVSKVYPGPADKQIWNNNPKQDSRYRDLIGEMNSAYYGNEHYAMFDIFSRADQTLGSRIRGWDMLRAHLKNSLNFPKMDRECIFFFNTCTNVSRILPTLVRHDKRREDIADGQEDHVADEIRYRVQHSIVRPRKIPTRMG